MEAISLDSICLLCINNRNAIEISSSPDSDTPKYLELIELLGEVEIVEELDELPNKICYKCALELINFYKFKLQIKDSYKKLKDLMQPTSNATSRNCEDVNTEVDEVNYNVALSPYLKEGSKICEYLKIEEYNKDTEEQSFLSYCKDINNMKDEIENHTQVSEEDEFNDLHDLHEVTETDEIELQLNTMDSYHIFNNKMSQNNKELSSILETKSNVNQLSSDELETWKKKLDTWIKRQGDETQSQKKQRFICDICGKNYGSKFALKNHLYVHTGEMNYECEDCGRRFGQKSLLYAHVKVKHNVTTMYSCNICGRNFNKKCNLSRHRWVHTDALRYPCEICGQAFKWKSCLDNHLNMHNGIGFGCELCDKTFATEAAIKKHCKKYHSGEGMKYIIEECKTE